MKRLACLIVFAAACGGSGFETADATMTGIVPTPKSASATSFTGADGGGNMVMGWKISLWEQGAGADCMSNDTHRVAAVSIYTNQAPVSGKKAMLDKAEIVIVTDSPPTVTGTYAATMGAEKISNIVGQVSITDFHLKPDLTVDDMKGSINAAGTDGNGANVAISGTFDAPVCE
ncbi:MAG TPA: hypothetical protein VFQ65_06510 [Kofleriaceae bacterium]|nr:hypothetical protein [Kofleriaceae bacterium]